MLWTYAGDDGRGLDVPALIRADLWPLDPEVDDAQIDEWQGELERNGRIIRYESNGRHYFEIVKFTDHQKPNRVVPSNIPDPPIGTVVPISPKAVSKQCSSSVEAVLEQCQSSPVVGLGLGLGLGEVEVDTSSADLADARYLAELLADKIFDNGSKRPTVTAAWVKAVYRMIHIDGRTIPDIKAAITWSQDDDFWRANIMSPEKLRKQFDRMRLQADRGHGRSDKNLANLDRIVAAVSQSEGFTAIETTATNHSREVES